MKYLRLAFAERESYLEALSEGYANGRLNAQEFTERRDLVLAATTHAEALAQLEGLPVPEVKSREVAKSPEEADGDGIPLWVSIPAVAAFAVVFLLVLVFSGSSEVVDPGPPVPPDADVVAVDDVSPHSVSATLDELESMGYTHISDSSFGASSEGLVAEGSNAAAKQFSQTMRDTITMSDASARNHQFIPIDDVRAMIGAAARHAGQHGLEGTPSESRLVVTADGAWLEISHPAESGQWSVTVDAHGQLESVERER